MKPKGLTVAKEKNVVDGFVLSILDFECFEKFKLKHFSDDKLDISKSRRSIFIYPVRRMRPTMPIKLLP